LHRVFSLIEGSTPDIEGRGRPMKDRLSGKKVLIVDDEPDVLNALAELLPMCSVVKASTFEQGKEQLETRPFDIAVLDIMGVNGYELLEIAIKKNVIALMVTAHALSPEHTVTSFRKGAAFFVPKEKMGDLEMFLNDVLEAREKGLHPRNRWLERLDDYYNKRFGPKWKDHDKEFWKKFSYYA
jgi:DNA-binding NtrC family response regulator